MYRHLVPSLFDQSYLPPASNRDMDFHVVPEYKPEEKKTVMRQPIPPPPPPPLSLAAQQQVQLPSQPQQRQQELLSSLRQQQLQQPSVVQNQIPRPVLSSAEIQALFQSQIRKIQEEQERLQFPIHRPQQQQQLGQQQQQQRVQEGGNQSQVRAPKRAHSDSSGSSGSGSSGSMIGANKSTLKRARNYDGSSQESKSKQVVAQSQAVGNNLANEMLTQLSGINGLIIPELSNNNNNSSSSSSSSNSSSNNQSSNQNAGDSSSATNIKVSNTAIPATQSQSQVKAPVNLPRAQPVIPLPITTIANLKALNASISRNKSVQLIFIKQMMVNGQSTESIEDCLAKILQRFVTLQVKREMVWAASSDTADKFVLGQTLLHRIIFQAVRFHCPTVTTDRIETLLKSWLRANPAEAHSIPRQVVSKTQSKLKTTTKTS